MFNIMNLNNIENIFYWTDNYLNHLKKGVAGYLC